MDVLAPETGHIVRSGAAPLVDAANFVRQAGGIAQAQQALKDLAKVAKALG
jgi:hypothetical protein